MLILPVCQYFNHPTMQFNVENHVSNPLQLIICYRVIETNKLTPTYTCSRSCENQGVINKKKLRKMTMSSNTISRRGPSMPARDMLSDLQVAIIKVIIVYHISVTIIDIYTGSYIKCNYSILHVAIIALASATGKSLVLVKH